MATQRSGAATQRHSPENRSDANDAEKTAAVVLSAWFASPRLTCLKKNRARVPRFSDMALQRPESARKVVPSILGLPFSPARSPQSIFRCPKIAQANPKTALRCPTTIWGKLQIILGVPRTMRGVPKTVGGDPRTIPGASKTVSYTHLTLPTKRIV